MSINLDEKVVVKNLCEWDLYFKRIEGTGDIKIARKGETRLTRAEIQAQVYANNSMFVGLDEKGNHAKILIDDKETRVLVGFESEEQKEQMLLTPDKVAKLLEYKTMSSFKKNVEDAVKTQAEKIAFIKEAKKQGLKDYDKIKFIEEYTEEEFDK